MHYRAAAIVGCVSGLLGCTAVTPPPIVPLHADPHGAEEGSTRVLVVVGGALQIPWGDGGLGAALRVERQASGADAFGVDLGGGSGREDRTKYGGNWKLRTTPGPRRWLVAARGYGRHALSGGNAVTYGAGASWFSTGLVTATADLGLAIGGHFRSAVDTGYVNVGLATAIPVRAGAPFGAPDERTPAFELYPYLGGGMIAEDGAGALSLDLTLAYAVRSYTAVGALSMAGTAMVD